MKVILDEGVPKQLAEALGALGVDAYKFPKHLRQMTNGELIKAVEAAGFDVLLTNDKNIASQQSLRGRNVAMDGTRRAKGTVSEDTVTEELPAVSPFSF